MVGRVAPHKFKVTQAAEVEEWDKRKAGSPWFFGCEALPLSSYHCSSAMGVLGWGREWRIDGIG